MVGVRLRAATAVAVLAVGMIGAPARPSLVGAQVPPALNAYGEAFLLEPARVLDTRTTGVPVAEGAPLFVEIAGAGGVPATGVSMVALNVTVTEATAASALRLFAADDDDHGLPNISFGPEETVPNLVVTRLGADGAVAVAVASGSANIVIDTVAWFADEGVEERGGRLTPVVPWRALDTRTTGALAPRDVVEVTVGREGVEATGVIVNLTGTGAAAATYVTAFPGGEAVAPLASNLNPLPGATRPNLAFVGLSPEGTIQLANGPGATDVVVDVLAYFTPDATDTTAGRILALEVPFRSLDTRDDGLALAGGATDGWDFEHFSASAAVPVKGLVANLTAVEATEPSFITTFPFGSPRPDTSNLNLVPGREATNLVVTDLSQPGRSLAVYGVAGAVHHVLDIVAVVLGDGWDPFAPAPSSPSG